MTIFFETFIDIMCHFLMIEAIQVVVLAEWPSIKEHFDVSYRFWCVLE